MEQLDLLMICVASFTAVFTLLAFLAVVMRILIQVFPEKVAETDAAILAALTTAVSALYPGTKITNVEEIK
jgi:hypothetical protein